MKIHTEVKFEAAHRLSDYEGKCNRMHGHNWKVEMDIEGEMAKETSMLFDFTGMKDIANEFDHKLILKNTAENRKLFGHLPENWVYWISVEPTAENFAKLIKQMVLDTINLAPAKQTVLAHNIKIRVWESDHAYAEA